MIMNVDAMGICMDIYVRDHSPNNKWIRQACDIQMAFYKVNRLNPNWNSLSKLTPAHLNAYNVTKRLLYFNK